MSAVDFGAPSPGSWELDADHHQRPVSPFLGEVFPAIYTEGFRHWMAKYGTGVECIECALIDDFAYMAVRPVGAPPEAKGAPPALLMKILSRLHPELRRRNRRATEVFQTKAWRAEREEYVKNVHPGCQRICDALIDVDLQALDDQGLAKHLNECQRALVAVLEAHFQVTGAHMIPVGDFLAHVIRWTGAAPSEILAALRGSSDASRGAEPELVRAVSALQEDGREIDPSESGARERLADLASEDGEVGRGVSAWLRRAQSSTVSGHSFVDVTGRDVPQVLLRTLADAVKNVRKESLGKEAADAAAAQLRSRVPQESRAFFDELLGEARLTYGLRDLRLEGVACGLTKHALEETGRRLAARGSLEDARHALSLTREQLLALLLDEGGPDPKEAAALHKRYSSRTAKDVPALIGPPPPPPPPSSALPAGLRRGTDALMAYLDSMWAAETSASNEKCGASADTDCATQRLVGHGASRGVQRGIAKIVKSPADFSRLEKGDILIAPITTPHYNVILPLLGGVVTDRGGILSHPAIVAREFGIPGVVGTKVATQTIPDGAMVEVDGAQGTVTVLQ
jgi:pyruvate,water dikinase